MQTIISLYKSFVDFISFVLTYDDDIEYQYITYF